MQLWNWWKRWKKGDAVCKVASADALNRVYNVLEDIEAVGLNGIDAQINKPTDANGRGWTITIDGWPITRTGAGRLLPFDIVKRSNGHYAVYVGSSNSAVEINNGEYLTICDTQLDANGYADIGTTATAAWLYVRVTDIQGGYPEYHWGVVNTYPSHSTGRDVAIWQIGAIAAGSITQFWRGRIRIADTHPDGKSVERGSYEGDLFDLQLLNFSAGQTATLSDITIPDWIVRLPDGGGGFVLDYVAGATLSNLISALVEQIVDQIIDELVDRSTTRGDYFLNALDSIYQPVVVPESTTDGTASGTYYGIPVDNNGKRWQPT